MSKYNPFENTVKYVLKGSAYQNKSGKTVSQIVVQGSPLNFSKTSIDARQAVVFKKACRDAGMSVDQLFDLLISQQEKSDKSAILGL